ncbi:hypothetical protein SDC9_126934 [bioreactor metagenome]|uniref:Uncharacterized protein n=1 Tax=bioreactor metagenome TaxID=1076179 RepID=A0A645CT64_9ZZZZ
MQVLLVGYDIEALCKIIGILSVERGSDIPRGVERRPIRAQDDARRHFILAQIDNLRALIELQETFFAQFVHNAAHFVVIETFTRVTVKADTENVVDLLNLFECKFFEPFEEREGFRIAILDALEPGTRLIVQRRIVLHLLMIAHVELDQLVHTAPLDGLPITPKLEGDNHLAKLRTPVAQVVDANGAEPEMVIDAIQRAADYRRRQMADVERLCDVDGGVVDADISPFAQIGTAEAGAFFKHAREHGLRLRRFVERKVDISARRLRLGDALRQLERGGKLRRNRRRCFAESLCELEAGESIIPHLRIRRRFEPGLQFVRTDSRLCREHGGDCLFKIHCVSLSPLSCVS